MNTHTPADPSLEYYFSPVQAGPFRRIRKAIGLVPEPGSRIWLRVMMLVAFAWLPVVIGALLAGQALSGGVSDPLLRHFGVHARFLIAVPLLILAEAVMERIIPPMVSHFVTSGLVEGDNLPLFRDALARAVRFRDSAWGTAVVLAVIAAAVTFSSMGVDTDEMSWAVAHSDGKASFGFAGWWFTFVSRPIFAGLLMIWVWRIIALWTLFWKVSKLKLRLVASHPDGVGGLGFLEGLAVACSPLVLAISVVLAGRWGHDVLYHGVHVESLRPLASPFSSRC